MDVLGIGLRVLVLQVEDILKFYNGHKQMDARMIDGRVQVLPIEDILKSSNGYEKTDVSGMS